MNRERTTVSHTKNRKGLAARIHNRMRSTLALLLAAALLSGSMTAFAAENNDDGILSVVGFRDTRAASVTITYDLDSYKEQNGRSRYGAPGQQKWIDEVSVVGISGTTENVPAEQQTYTVRDVSTRYRRTEVIAPMDSHGFKNKYLYSYTFFGFQSNTGKIYRPGDTIDLSVLSVDNVKLKAIWSAHFLDAENPDNYSRWTNRNETTNTVAFYVVTNGKSGAFNPEEKYKYTGAVYTTSIIEGPDDPLYLWTAGGGQWKREFIGKSQGTTDEDELFETDAKIRNLVNGVTVEGVDGRTGTYRVMSMPGDDEIIRAIKADLDRTKGDTGIDYITVDDVRYDYDDINTENFYVLWYMFKNDTTDGWHIDGIIRRKPAQLTIKKIFSGAQEVIDQILNATGEDAFRIEVSQSQGQGQGIDPKEYTLNLQEKSDQNPGGYVENDGNTYTWVVEDLIPGPRNEYPVTVKEYNYESPSGDYNHSESWTLTHKGEYNEDQTSSGNNDTATVEACYSYQSEDYNTYQTVTFTNQYTNPYTLTFIKQDETTSHGLSGVSFKFRLYKVEGGSETQIGDEKTVTTDQDGHVTLDFENWHLEQGTYKFYLDEQEHPNYKSQLKVQGTFELDESGVVNVTAVEGKMESGEDGIVRIDENDTAIVYIVNQSEHIQVKVEKKWIHAAPEEIKQVTVEILRDGVPVDTRTPVVLSEENDWTHIWTELPVYVDNKKVEYTVRETWIGDPGDPGSSYYTPTQDEPDGFDLYKVVMIREVDENGNVSITVENTPEHGQVDFTKTDAEGAALEGAEFTVYTDEACTQKAQQIGTSDEPVYTSGEDGSVIIKNLKPGTYYVKETAAPDPYTLSNTVYKLVVKTKNSTFTTLDGTAVDKVVNKKFKVSKRSFEGSEVASTELAGAELAIYKAEDWDESTGKPKSGAVAIDTWTTGTDPHRINKWPETGDYVLVETSAPSGYVLLPGPVKFTVTASEEIKLSDGMSPEVKELVDLSTQNGEITLTVKNKSAVKLPSTGGTGTFLYTAVGMILIFVSALVFTRRRVRNRVQ